MRTTRGNENLLTGQTQLSIRLGELLERWREICHDVHGTLANAWALRRRNRETPDPVAGVPLPDAAGHTPDRLPVETERAAGSADATQPDVTSITERPEALAALCDRLLEQLDSTEVSGAEIRFVVHKHQPAAHPRLDPDAAAQLSIGELVLELRRLIAWAGAALADVTETLETRGVDLDESGRELLRDEITALDIDLSVLKAHLADPVDWDSQLEHLLSGEIGPFDDPAADENDDSDD
jgi:hypothetical protein